MKKRQRVVRSEAGATNTAAATTTTSSLPAVEGATPQVSIPTLDIFSRFQSRRDDFEADWMMLHDDVSTESKPIGTDVAQRLAAHRDQLGDLRRQRAAEASTSSASPQVGVAHQANVDDGDDDDDEADYQPEEVGAAQYAAATTATTSNTEVVEEGLQGDYLDFSSRVPSTNNNNNNNNNASAAAMPLWCATRIERFGAYSANPLIALHQELTDVLDFLRPTEMEVVLRRYVELNVCAIAKTLWPECEPIVYGSMLTQLVLPLSDIDLTLLNVPVSQEEALTAVAREVSRRGLCEEAYPQVILKTKVPLVKFQHKGSLIDVDISVGAGDGQRNSDMVVRLLRQYPEARPLIIIIKYFLLQRDMHEPYHGGLGSYATTLLVISFLQHHPITTTNREERAYSGLGRLLVDFFRYAGQYWNYNKCGISVDGRGRNFVRNDGGGGGSYRSPTSPNSPRSPMGPPQAIIEDPGNATNNAASSLRNYNMISSVFSHAYLSLTANFSDDEAKGATSLDAVDLAQRPTLLSRILHVDRRLVEQRQRVARVYQHMMQTQPEELEAARHYREEEDQSMLAGGSPTTGERQTLATLSAAAAKMAASSSSSSSHLKRKRSLSSSSSNDVVGSSSSSGDDDDDDEGSNASSIRVEVAPQRRKRE